MSFLQWDDTLDLGVKEMNEEHQELIRLMNALHDAEQAKASKEDMTSILSELKQYTIKHFSDEEAYMQSINYNGLDTHKFIHKDLLSKLGNYEKKFIASGKLGDEFYSFLKLWLVSHIKGIDKKYTKSS